MDEINTFIRGEKDGPKEQPNWGTKSESSDLVNRELDSVKTNEVPCTESFRKLKYGCTKKRKNPANNLQEDTDENLQERLSMQFSKVNIDEYLKGIEQADEDKLNYSSKKKNIRKTVVSYLRNSLMNPTETMKNIKCLIKKGIMPKALKPKSVEETKKEEQMNVYKEIFKDEVSQSKFDVLEYSNSALVSFEKRNIKHDVPTEMEVQYESSNESKDVALVEHKGRITSKSTTSYVYKTSAQSSKVRSGKKVFEHFRGFMQFPTESLNNINSEVINKEDTTHFSELAIKSSNDAIKVTKDMVCQDLEDSSNVFLKSALQNLKDSKRADMEMTKSKNSKIMIDEKASNQIDNLENRISRQSTSVPRQRIVYDESIEFIRGWIIQQIKDRELLLQFKIMEGKLTKDVETKMQCIEEAEDLQEVIDTLFDLLDDTEKIANNNPVPSKRFKGDSDSIERYSSERTKRYSSERINDMEWLKSNIKSFSSLFCYMYKFPSFSSNNKIVFERMSLITFMTAFANFLDNNIERDHRIEISENNAKSAVDLFYFSLIQSRSKFESEFSYTEKVSLDDYLNYIDCLKMVANERLICLETLLDLKTSVILPLMYYLSQSQISYFLGKERLNLFSEPSNKNEVDYEDFCRRHLEKWKKS